MHHFILFLSLVVISASSTATVVIYSDRSAYESQLFILNNIDFEGEWGGEYWAAFGDSAGLTINDVNFLGPTTLFAGSDLQIGNNTGWGVENGLVTGDFLVGPFSQYGEIIINLPENTNAVGFDFVAGDHSFENTWFNFELSTGETIDIELEASELGFFGVISGRDIASITMKIAPEHLYVHPAIDNVTYGVAAVPLPAAAWLFSSALIGLAAIKRKK